MWLNLRESSLNLIRTLCRFNTLETTTTVNGANMHFFFSTVICNGFETQTNDVLLMGASDQKTLLCVILEGMDKYILSFDLSRSTWSAQFCFIVFWPLYSGKSHPYIVNLPKIQQPPLYAFRLSLLNVFQPANMSPCRQKTLYSDYTINAIQTDWFLPAL